MVPSVCSKPGSASRKWARRWPTRAAQYGLNDPSVFLLKWVGALSPSKQAQHREPMPVDAAAFTRCTYGLDASSHLLCGVPAVVGTHPDHHRLGAEVFQLPVPFSRHHSPCCVLSPPRPKVSACRAEKSSRWISPLVRELDQGVPDEEDFRFLIFAVGYHGAASLRAQLVKNPPAMQETGFYSWVGKICCRRDRLPTPVSLGFPCGSAGKGTACNEGDLCSRETCFRSLRWEDHPGEGKGYPLQYSGLENSMAWRSPWGLNESGMTERLSLSRWCRDNRAPGALHVVHVV